MNIRWLPLFSLRCSAAGAVGLMLVLTSHPAGQGLAPASLTLLSKEGRRTVLLTLVNGQEFVALDDLAAAFQLTVLEESLGALTVNYNGKTIVLTPDQALASVSGRLVSLPAAPALLGRRWMVPVEFISRALAPIYDTPLDLRKPSRLLIVGELRVPRVIVRYEPLGTSARLTIDATPRASSTVSQDDNQLTITFDADALDVASLAIQPQGLVESLRVLEPVTLAIDLGPRFAAFRAVTKTGDTTTRLTLDFLPAQTQTAVAPPTRPIPSPSLDLSTRNQPALLVRTIAIDPGHGGEDEGVKGPGGAAEKDVTLAVARRLKARIEGRLGIRVLLTRDEDRHVGLDDRAAVANNSKADLFISLHANGSRRNTASGASVLYAAFDREAERARRVSLESQRLPALGGGMRDVELVVWDLAQIRHIEHSAEFAKILEQQIQARVPLGPLPVDRAPLRVLGSANMPAVLVEMGYLTNADQEKQIASAAFQNTFVQAISDAVLKYRDGLASRGGQ